MDLIKIISEGRKEGLKDEEISRQVAETVLEELRQMSLEDFVGCFTYAALNRKTNIYDVMLSFKFPEVKEKAASGGKQPDLSEPIKWSEEQIEQGLSKLKESADKEALSRSCPQEEKAPVYLSQKDIDCIMQHLKVFRDQDLLELEASWGEPCEICGYNDSCDFQFYRHMAPLVQKSNVEFTMMVSLEQIRQQYKARRERKLDTDIPHCTDNHNC